MVRYLTLILTLFALSAQVSQAAEMRRFKVGNWYAGAYTKKTTGEFGYCAADARYKSGITVIFLINRNFHWSMSFINPDWNLRVGARYPIAFNVDRLRPISGVAIATTPRAITVPLKDSSALFEQFREGRLLRVATAQRVFSFKLTDTSRLLPVLLKCAINKGRTVEASSNPFAPKSQLTTPQTNDRSLNRAEATAFAANLLSKAGISKFKFLTPTEFPTFRGDARWVSSGSTVGTVNVLSRLKPEHHKNLSAFLIGRDAKSCTGAFLSGAMPAKDGTLAHVFTTCRKDGKPTVVYYLAVPRKAGGAYLISTASFGSEKPAKEADASFVAAVMREDVMKEDSK